MDKTQFLFSTIIWRNTFKVFKLNLIKSVGPQEAKAVEMT